MDCSVQFVKETPFNYETQILNRLEQIEELRNLIESNTKITGEYVISALNPIEKSLNELHENINKLLSKKKQTHET
jgi:predicted DNA-binding protein (UPF0278 family)